MTNKDFKNYLPSKNFTASLLVIVVVFIFAILVKEAFQFAKSYFQKDSADANPSVTVGEIIQEDTNKNGIPDWEEYLWGLDPAKNGPENKAFILAKKKSLTESGDIVVANEEKVITDNEMLSRNLLSAILALESSGELNEETIKTISETIGSGVEVEDIPDKYTSQNLKVVETSPSTVRLYHKIFTDIYSSYANKDLGSEITLISIGLGSSDAQSLRAAKTIASYYLDFAEELSKIEVPSSVATLHTKAINDLVKIGSALDGLTMSLADPILGMKSVVWYNKYSNEFYLVMNEMTEVVSLSSQ